MHSPPVVPDQVLPGDLVLALPLRQPDQVHPARIDVMNEQSHYELPWAPAGALASYSLPAADTSPQAHVS